MVWEKTELRLVRRSFIWAMAFIFGWDGDGYLNREVFSILIERKICV